MEVVALRRGSVERSQRKMLRTWRGKELLEKRGLKKDAAHLEGARRGGVERSQRRYCTNRRGQGALQITALEFTQMRSI